MLRTPIFSVWDGDWAILEEYGTSNTITQKYLQGYHGLVKTLVDNIYYYQDELGSTSHIANASGALLEYYKYNLYGKPTYWSAANSQLSSSNYNVRDLGDGGARWIVELGLYDDRNRFMSPDLGRFIQPDPIGFKGDASNLYRYCGNDWANRSDPMGLFWVTSDPVSTAQFRNTEADSMGIEQFQKLAQLARGLIVAQLDVKKVEPKDTAKVQFSPEPNKANLGYTTPAKIQEIAGGNNTRAFTLVQDKDIVTKVSSNSSSGLDVNQTVTARTYLPESERKAVEAHNSTLLGQEMKRISVFRHATWKAETEAKGLAAKGFKNAESARNAVFESTRKIIHDAAAEGRGQFDLWNPNQ